MRIDFNSTKSIQVINLSELSKRKKIGVNPIVQVYCYDANGDASLETVPVKVIGNANLGEPVCIAITTGNKEGYIILK